MTNFKYNNTDDVIDVRDVIARFEELDDQRTPRYVAGWNMPGYMPDSEPVEFEDADDALEYIKDAAKNAIEQDSSEDAFEQRSDDVDSWTADKTGEFGNTFGNYHYWISQDGFMGLDDDETAEHATLQELLSELCGNGEDEQWRGDWYPITLIRDSYFEQAMDELLEDIGDLPKDLPSYLSITVDYKALQMDYAACEIDGVTYWYR